MSSFVRAIAVLPWLLLPASSIAADEAAPAASAASAAPDLPPAKFLEQAAPTVVSFKYVLKWANGERPYTALGTVVDPSGLIVLGNEYLGSGETKAVDMKVTFGNDPKEWSTVIVARDAPLGLGWVQVVGLEKPVPAVDFGKGGDGLAMGQDVRSVWRTGRGFDYAPVMGRHYLSALIDKPRTMWSVAGDSMQLGLAVFDLAGRPLGVTVQQSASSGEADAGSGRFLLPLVDVRKSLDQAKKRVPEALAKAAEKSVDGPEAKPVEKPTEPPSDKPAEKPPEPGMDTEKPPAPEQPK